MLPPLPLALVPLLALLGAAQEYTCVYRQRLEPRRAYTIASPGFPAHYQAGESCLWVATAVDADSRVVLDCDTFELPAPRADGECSDALWVSASGRAVGVDGEPHCGSGRFTVVSSGPRLNVKLISQGADRRGGLFRCSVAATNPATDAATPATPPPAPAPRPPPGRPGPVGNCTCARRQPEATRVAGGVATAPHEYPSVAYLEDGEAGRLLCGATLLSPRYGLTAAHCAEQAVDKQNVNLVVGDHDRSQPDWRSLRQVIRVRDFIVHPEYSGSWAGADIAVVRLARHAVMGPAVQPACLPFLLKKANFAGQPVQVLGWGSQQLDGPSSIRLMSATLKVVKNSVCSKAYGWDMTDSHICAFRRDASPCSGDNGGPLLWQNPTTHNLILVGLVSAGSGCPGERPIIGTRVTHHLRWIQQVTREQYCYVE